MKLNLLPRQDKFFTLLTALAAKAAEGASLLKQYVEAEQTARREIAGKIFACRVQSKELMNEMTAELSRSFVTPFDREDIQQFSQYLYRIPKMIKRVVQRMDLHGLSADRADFAKQVGLIMEESEAMEAMVRDLIERRNTKQVMEKVTRLHELEQRGDDILQELLASLFAETRDTRDLLIRKDIYDMLEKVVDSYRNAAAVTLQIVLKYS
jgi:uncharacterized protein Yka (UPF0111/DUF47 family)